MALTRALLSLVLLLQPLSSFAQVRSVAPVENAPSFGTLGAGVGAAVGGISGANLGLSPTVSLTGGLPSAAGSGLAPVASVSLPKASAPEGVRALGAAPQGILVPQVGALRELGSVRTGVAPALRADSPAAARLNLPAAVGEEEGPKPEDGATSQGRDEEGKLRPSALSQLEAIAAPRTSSLRDFWDYTKIVTSSLWWYTGPRLIERWKEVRDELRGNPDGRRSVVELRGFFIAHRVLGSTGSYSPLGFRVASNRRVVNDALYIYDRYFRAPPEAYEALLRLLARATKYNPNRRSTQFRKVIFHALRHASVLPPEKVAPYFDGLLDLSASQTLADYQAKVQPGVLAKFDKVVNRVILQVNAGQPKGSRIAGALLLGSFANGAAGPGSDLDVQAISEDGRATLNEQFIRLLKSEWKKEGTDSPVSGFQYALPQSKALIARVHREPYLIYSPYPEVLQAMSRTPEEEAADAPSRSRTLKGWFFQKVYSQILWVTLALHDGAAAVKRRIFRRKD